MLIKRHRASVLANSALHWAGVDKAMSRARNAIRCHGVGEGAVLGALSLVGACGTVGQDPWWPEDAGEPKGGTGASQMLAFKTLEAENGRITGAGNVIQGFAAPNGWALFQNTGALCWSGVDVRGVTGFEVRYGQPEPTAERFRLRFGYTAQGTVTLGSAGYWQAQTGRVRGVASGTGASVTVCLDAMSDHEVWVASIDKVVLLKNRAGGSGACAGTTGSKVVGRELCVDGAPWRIKGVNYNPIERCEWNQWQNWGAAASDAALLAAGKFNTIRTFSILSDKVLFKVGGAALTCATAADCPDPVHNVCTEDAMLPSNVCRAGFLSDAQLSEFLRRGIRVIPTVHIAGAGPAGAWNVYWVDKCGDGRADNPGPAGGDFPPNYKTHLNRVLNHPAVIAASVGNEIAYNFFYTKDPGGAWTNCWTLDDAVKHANYVVERVKAVNSKKPVVVSWGNTNDIGTKVPQIKADIISYQIYNQLSLDDIFKLHPRYSSKPFFISEAGADAYNAKIGAVDTAAQAHANVELFKQVLDNATTGANGTAAHRVLGMTIFEFMDEYWKASGDSCVQETSGVAPGGGPYPDRTFNEEYWGVVENGRDPKTGMRKPRPTYYKLRDLFEKY